jgi:hypothetical protein
LERALNGIGKSPDPQHGPRLHSHNGHSLLGLRHRFQPGRRPCLGPLLRPWLRLGRITPQDDSKVETEYLKHHSVIHLNLSLLQRPFPRFVVATAAWAANLSSSSTTSIPACVDAHIVPWYALALVPSGSGLSYDWQVFAGKAVRDSTQHQTLTGGGQRP